MNKLSKLNSNSKTPRSDHLFSTPSFLTGIGSSFNVPGNYYEFNESNNPDARALSKDWEAVGEDIKKSLRKR